MIEHLVYFLVQFSLVRIDHCVQLLHIFVVGQRVHPALCTIFIGVIYIYKDRWQCGFFAIYFTYNLTLAI